MNSEQGNGEFNNFFIMEEKYKALAGLSAGLREELLKVSTEQEIPAGQMILREGQYVKVIPLVITGLIKVFTAFEEKELLLYYIRPEQSCIMSFAASLRREPSSVFAMTEEDSVVLLLPVEHVLQWTLQYPEINTFFFDQFYHRYEELISTINQVLFSNMENRLLGYLTKKSRVTGQNPLVVSHSQIATELGTAREVVSRVIKKLEADGKVRQLKRSIEIL